jgi:hypothetical protein
MALLLLVASLVVLEGWQLMWPALDACRGVPPVKMTGITQGITPDALRLLLLLLQEPPEACSARLMLLLLLARPVPCRVAPADPATDWGRLASTSKGLGPAAHSGPSATSSWSAVMLMWLLLVPLLLVSEVSLALQATSCCLSPLLLLLPPLAVRAWVAAAAVGCLVATLVSAILLALRSLATPSLTDVAAATTGRPLTPDACLLLLLLMLLLCAAHSSWLKARKGLVTGHSPVWVTPALIGCHSGAAAAMLYLVVGQVLLLPGLLVLQQRREGQRLRSLAPGPRTWPRRVRGAPAATMGACMLSLPDSRPLHLLLLALLLPEARLLASADWGRLASAAYGLVCAANSGCRAANSSSKPMSLLLLLLLLLPLLLPDARLLASADWGRLASAAKRLGPGPNSGCRAANSSSKPITLLLLQL